MPFYEFTSNEYLKDPVFENNACKTFGDTEENFLTILFYSSNYQYALVNPDEIKKNKEQLFRIATYLYYHGSEKNGMSITYFIGDINYCEKISADFRNQIVKTVSIEMINEWWPKNISEINERVISFLFEMQTHYGEFFNLKDLNLNYLFFTSKNLSQHQQKESLDFLIRQILEEGYLIEKRETNDFVGFAITRKGMELIGARKRSKNTAFIALKFEGNEERIQTIQEVIAHCGYDPIVMNEYEHNEWIMPEIFYQIREARFLVVDLSLDCAGAYYEAGYAQALGKQVIQLCEKSKIDNLHFDVKQKSTIIYVTLEELKEKLSKRIISTIEMDD